MSTGSSPLEAESLRWLSRLDGQMPSVEEREAFERWKAAPGHAAAFEEAERFWRGFDQLLGDPEVEQLTAKALMKSAADSERPASPGWFWPMAASLAIAVVGAAAFFAAYHVPTRTLATEAGQRSTIRLEDGSDVVLNFATVLEVRFEDSRRQFRLLQGEAVFTVTEDPRRPFVVSAGDGQVTALGTRFQVRNEARHVTVTLLEGKVALDRAERDQHMQMKPGDQVRFNVDVEPLSLRTVNPDAVSSWTRGRLKFEATPLQEVLAEVNRYLSAPISVLDPSLAQTPVTGAFEIGDGDAVVSGLRAMLPLEVTRRDNGATVLSRR